MVNNCNDIQLTETINESGVVLRDALELAGIVAAIFLAGAMTGFAVAWTVL